MWTIVRSDLAKSEIDLGDVSIEQIAAVRARRAELLKAFSALAPGESSELEFPIFERAGG